ncbi:MAG: YbaK/EbsC family protein [Caldilineaceae bacterium]
MGADIEKADAVLVRAETGFVIGGVPPVGHIRPLPTVIDEDLLQFEALWAAAGTPNGRFKLSAVDLRCWPPQTTTPAASVLIVCATSAGV